MPFKTYRGHGGNVTKVMFTSNGERVISTGGKDGVALQWIVKKGASADDQSSSENED
jgi:WD40 repeat protein